MRYLTTIIIVLLYTISMAQNATSASVLTGGASSKNSHIHLSYAIGQISAPTMSPKKTPPTTPTQELTETEQNKTAHYSVNSINTRVYPNPTTDWIAASCKTEEKMHVRIFDISGRPMNVIVNTPTVNSNGEQHFIIQVEQLPTGNYILQLIGENQSQKPSSFKFQKK